MPRVKNRNRYTFTHDTLIKIFDTISNPKIVMACFISRMCGLRVEEVSSLKWENIDFDNQRMEVLNSKWKHRTRDGYGKDRKVRMPKIMLEPLRMWKEITNGGTWVFPSDKSPDSHLTKKVIYNQYHDFLKRAGLLEPHYTIVKSYIKRPQETVTRYKLNYHSLRAYYITDCRRRGIKLEIIAKQVGHDDINTTMGYTRFSDEEVDKIIDIAFEKPIEQLQIPRNPGNPFNAHMPNDNLSPKEELQRMLIRNQITREEYLEKLSLLDSPEIKKVIEIRNN